MLGSVLALALWAETGQVERGRDPWVFRAVFEDRPRSLIVAAGNDVWFAFNPTTCAFHKVWQGSFAFKGKVYDFSQDSSVAVGEVLAKSYDVVFDLPNQAALPEGWRSEGVSFTDGWKFEGDGSYLESPAYDLSGFDTLYVAFDERSRKGRLRVEVRNGGEVTEWFGSTMSVDSDTSWWWNFKYLLDRGTGARIRFVQESAGYEKMMRSARLLGDRPGWALMTPGGLEGAKAEFRGYETDGTRAVRIDFDLVGEGGRVRMQVRPEVFAAGSSRQWSAQYQVVEATAGYRPVMLGWNEHLDAGSMQGVPARWRGLEGTVVQSATFAARGGVN